MTRRFKGNHLDSERLLSEIKHEDRIWCLYDRGENNGWHNFKLVLKEGRAAKANYWLAGSPEKQASGRDYRILKMNNPGLFEEVQERIGMFVNGEAS
ncbi:MAG: hypothetical protein AAFV59_14315 [Pseudomonadota bacterium]